MAIVNNDAHTANSKFSLALQKAQLSSSLDATTQSAMKEMVAFSYVRLGEGGKAEPLLHESILGYSRKYGPNSPNVLRSRIYLAQAYMVQGKCRDAVHEVDLLYPSLVARLGEDNQITMTALGTRAASEGCLKMWDAGARDDLTLYNIAVRKRGPASAFAVSSLVDASLSLCRGGRYADGERYARNAFTESARAFGPRAGITGGGAYSLAVCLIGLDRLPEASELLQSIDANAVSQLSGDSTVAASIALAEGQIAARRGEYAIAQRYIEAAAPAFERPNADPYQKETLENLESTVDSHLRARK